MDLNKRMEEVREKFSNYQAIMDQKYKEIETIRKEADNKIIEINREIAEIGAEMNCLQGEFRLLAELQEEDTQPKD